MSGPLTPCPFCGGPEVEVEVEVEIAWVAFVHCCECGAAGPAVVFHGYPESETQAEAISEARRLWNQRREAAS